MRGFGEDGRGVLGNCQRALRNESLHDLLAVVIRRMLWDVGVLTAEKHRVLSELMQD